MKLIVEHHHYIHSGSDEPTTRLLNLILKNQHTMSDELNQMVTTYLLGQDSSTQSLQM